LQTDGTPCLGPQIKEETQTSSLWAGTAMGTGERDTLVDQVRVRFDREAQRYAAERKHSHAYRVQQEHVVRALPPWCAIIVDVGAGPALLADELGSRVATYYAVDLSVEMLRSAQHQSVTDNVYSIACDASKLSFPDAFAHVIVAMGVLEYVPQPSAAMRGFWRILVPDGLAVVTVPNGRSLYGQSRRLYWFMRTAVRRVLRLNTEPDTRIGIASKLPHRWPATRWTKIARAVGYEVVSVAYCNSRLIAHPLRKRLVSADDWLSARTEFLCRLPVRSLAGDQIVMVMRKHCG